MTKWFSVRLQTKCLWVRVQLQQLISKYGPYFFDKRKTRSGVRVIEKLPKELHKQIIKKFKRRRVYTRFKDNIWTADLAETGSLSSKY